MIKTMVANWYSEQKETEQQEFREFVKRELIKGVIDVIFTKKDGTERKMSCTLKSDIVVPYEKKTDKSKETPTDVCPVFDVEKQEWRSFKYDNIRSISTKL
jgi:hypothetical protein